ncbi:hypothetical protein H257_13186 [Aphanomyces astaci]|uniref:Uncharacterized protein n=1 Tax=Aphanomyces astaci TaxID=112090 RepID=W4FXY4_APHAT|nr:hypothetical protein H257_13186 [Aphanomyces astaci]ETV71523.1 hypothetical protein H257_13186 [Aphanomyces astaci]|eukprot:XP_009838956.1 hypothetical protein H257_13186 [Aphanomyces astaci]
MKMPLAMKRSTVFIQQDNAGPHAQSVNNSIERRIDGDGWTIKMRNQPPNIPDFNGLDEIYRMFGEHNSHGVNQLCVCPKMV